MLKEFCREFSTFCSIVIKFQLADMFICYGSTSKLLLDYLQGVIVQLLLSCFNCCFVTFPTFIMKLLLTALILSLLLPLAMSVPQMVSGISDGSLSGSIVSPWGGNLGGSYTNPYGSFSNAYSGYGRYSNAAGFL